LFPTLLESPVELEPGASNGSDKEFVMYPEITFLGATESVTGSRYLIDSGDFKLLIDAGLYQGAKSLEDKNWERFFIDPREIDAIVITHAHLDHCGYLPLLVREGFGGKIYSTQYTRKLAGVILRDSAHLQMEDAKYAREKGYSKHKNPQALYDLDDVEKTLTHFVDVPYHEPLHLTDDFRVTFYPSGHILGSAYLITEVSGKKILSTSDMGRPTHPILVSPDDPPKEDFDVVVTESTYGNRLHETSPTEFGDVVSQALSRRGVVLIPAFAVDRTEVILMAIRDAIVSGRIPQVPIFVDSPMALASLAFYREAITNDAPEIRQDIKDIYKRIDLFDPGSLYQMSTVEESKSLNEFHGSCIIISASGMASGGRVVHHLEHILPHPENTVVLVGYQSAGSRGHALAQGASEIRIHGQMVPVNATVKSVESFSVHADSDELIHWLKKITSTKKVYVVHGETDASHALAKRISQEFNWIAEVPRAEHPYAI
jgi:metallo-beta-lactamase family protein